MQNLRFEYRIVISYLIIGVLWIIFSDKILYILARDIDALNIMQTYKGGGYVLITALLFFVFLKRHLARLRYTESELEGHKDNLQQMVKEKTKELDTVISKLSATNDELHEKNEIISRQNNELKATIQNLEVTQEQLIQAEKMASLGVLTAGVAHEINNPLNFIMGGLTGLESTLGEEKSKSKKIELYLKSIKTGVERAGSIVSGLNQLSRKDEFQDEDCELHTIIDNCLSVIHNQLNGKIEIYKNFEDKELIVPGNIGQLHQVFLNILVNAVQAIENEGSITISTEERKGKAIVVIKDTGSGIIKEHLPKITDPFFTTKEPGKGTGIGLSIAYNIIQSHKGKIVFQSEQNSGTTVKVELQLKPSKNE